MPKITGLPTDTTITFDDFIPIVDNSGPTTKKITLATLLGKVYPVGCIFVDTTNNNPATRLGFGTWTAFGAGRVPVGYDNSQAEFNTLEATGGDKNLQAHAHGISDPGHYHQERVATTGGSGVGISGTSNIVGNQGATQDTGGAFTGISVSPAGTGGSGNLQPYIVVTMWKRTA